MAPLFLVFKNEDSLGDDIRILYKNGDGKNEFDVTGIYTTQTPSHPPFTSTSTPSLPNGGRNIFL